MSAVPTTAERFQAFQANHGTIDSPLADRILGTFFDRAIFRFFEYPQQVNLQAYVQREMKNLAPDILATLELAADWSADPVKAAGRQLRAELDAKTAAEETARKQREESALHTAIQAKADAFTKKLQAEMGTAKG